MALVIDTGVLYAAFDRADADHGPCRELLESTQEMMLVPGATLPEVDYWMRMRLGSGAMVALLRDIHDDVFRIEDLEREDLDRVAEIVDRYSDMDVGFVDASVLAIVERLGEPKLATLDRRHFTAMRPRHVDALELLPA